MLKRAGSLLLSGMLSLVSANSINCIETVETKTTIVPLAFRMIMKWEDINNDWPRSLEEIAEYQKSCLKPAFELNHDEWKSAERTHREGYGDCEDYALNAAYFLEKIGHEPVIMIFPVDNKQSGHVINLIKKKGEDGKIKYGCMDNGNYREPAYSSLDELAKSTSERYIKKRQIKHPWNGYSIVNINTIKCDWRHGKGNLQDYFIQFVNKRY